MAKKKQLYKKKAILRSLNGKTVDEAIANLQELSRLNYGACKIEISATLTSGPNYWRQYTGKIKCNILIPKED